MSEFASDAKQFIMTFFEPISESAPHIYISALPFSAQNSKISLHFMKYFAKTLKIEKGQMKYRSESCVLKIKGANRSVAYSPDGKYIVSGSQDKSVKVWRVQDLFFYGSLHVKDGWVQSSDGSCFGWIVPWLRSDFYLPAHSLVVFSDHTYQIDTDTSLVGASWVSCWK